MASSGPALTALLVFAAMSAVLANPYRYPVNSAEVQKLLGGQLLQNAIKQWKLNNAGQQPAARYVDLQRQNANAMYNGMDSAQAASCIADENVSIFPLGDLNIRICRTSADCYTFFLRLVDIEVTVVLCEKSGGGLCVDVQASINDCSGVLPSIDLPLDLPGGVFLIEIQVLPPKVCVSFDFSTC